MLELQRRSSCRFSTALHRRSQSCIRLECWVRLPVIRNGHIEHSPVPTINTEGSAMVALVRRSVSETSLVIR